MILLIYGGPLRGAMPILYVRLPIPYACGIHELICGDGGAVDMYVSYVNFIAFLLRECKGNRYYGKQQLFFMRKK